MAVDFARAAAGEDDEAEPSREPVVVEVVEHVNLNSSRSDKETIHLALAFEDGAPAYEPGDSLEIFPENDPQLVDEILNAAGLSGTRPCAGRCSPSGTSPRSRRPRSSGS